MKLSIVSIFRANDIRGIYSNIEEEGKLSPNIAFKIAFSFCALMKIKGKPLRNIALAGDARGSTEAIKNAIMHAFTSAGVNVFDLKLGPTPMIYSVAAYNDYIDAGVMVTASHNPQEFNGIKFCDENGVSFDFESAYGWIEENLNIAFEVDEVGLKKNGDYLREQYYFRLEQFAFHNPPFVLVECGNGATGRIGKVLKNLNCNVEILHEEPDGSFPNLLPDPSKISSYKFLKERFEEFEDKDQDMIGVIFDGDGDRVGFCIKDYGRLSPEEIAMLFIRDIARRHKDPIIITDSKMSKAVADYVALLGGQCLISKVGHSYVHKYMIEKDSIFAAELSGHFYFHDDHYGYDDGIYTALRFLEMYDLMLVNGENIIEILNSFPRYCTSEELRIPMDEERQIDTLEKAYALAEELEGRIYLEDGVRCELDDSWFIVRRSITEDLISIRCEGKSQKTLDDLLNQMNKLIME